MIWLDLLLFENEDEADPIIKLTVICLLYACLQQINHQ